MGSFVAGLDATVVNVALPAIEQDLGGGLSGQQWVSNAYLLALGSLILVGRPAGGVAGLGADLGGGLSGQQWVSNAYLLALGSLILVGGWLGDVFGERRVFAV